MNEHTPEGLARILNDIEESKRNLEEKELEEILFIAEHQGYISQPQDICFMSVIGNYKGSKFEEYMNRYLILK